jgi:hypothetical protein
MLGGAGSAAKVCARTLTSGRAPGGELAGLEADAAPETDVRDAAGARLPQDLGRWDAEQSRGLFGVDQLALQLLLGNEPAHGRAGES